MRWKKTPDRSVLKYLWILILIPFLYIAWIVFSPVHTDELILRVKTGDNARTIASKLSKLGLIRSKILFIQLAKLSGSDRALQVGTYTFGGKMNCWGAVKKLKKGQSKTLKLTFPEGLSLFKMSKIVDRKGLASNEEFISAVTDTALVRELTGFSYPSLEGFLYPETYIVDVSLPLTAILQIQTTEFFKRLHSSGIEITDPDEFYRILILASIVEKEAVLPEEKPIIAGVYLNRMRIGMRLESCPTVDYILEKRGIRRKALTANDTKINSPYNTYQVDGLPPTPICNPSVSSIQAVINPAKHNYLFFFADYKGKNIFSHSFDEHLNKQRHYRRS